MSKPVPTQYQRSIPNGPRHSIKLRVLCSMVLDPIPAESVISSVSPYNPNPEYCTPRWVSIPANFPMYHTQEEKDAWEVYQYQLQ
jgi:hypothetical protein